MFRSLKRLCFMVSLAAVFLAGFSLGSGEMTLSAISTSFAESMEAMLDPEEAMSFVRTYLPEVDLEMIVETVAELTDLVGKMLQ